MYKWKKKYFNIYYFQILKKISYVRLPKTKNVDQKSTFDRTYLPQNAT